MEILDAPAFVIHMDIPESRNRRPFFTTNMMKAGFKDIRTVDGVDVRTDRLLSNAKEEFGVMNIHPDYSRGQLGATFSHMKAWKSFLDTGLPVATIWEDDVFFHPQWDTLFHQFYKATPKDYDLIFMGNQSNPKGNTDMKTDINSLPCFCNHSYVITRKGAEILLTLIQVTTKFKSLYTMDCMIIDYMKCMKSWIHLPFFKWYCWNGRRYPCKESENTLSVRNDGLVFQSDVFPSIADFKKID